MLSYRESALLVMQLKVLGCSGGVGGNLRTTSFLLDEDILIDAGTGVGDLSFEELCRIDHIFLTHSHLDHVTSIPFLLDTVMGKRTKPIYLHALDRTIEALKSHIFNWVIWPDFNLIPNADSPVLQYCPIKVGETVSIDERNITPLTVNHVVPAVGFRIDSGSASLVFTGDTTKCDELWEEINRIQNLKYLIIETAYSNAERELALVSKHLCPSLLTEELKKLRHESEIFITHLKPDERKLIMDEIKVSAASLNAKALENGQVFRL